MAGAIRWRLHCKIYNAESTADIQRTTEENSLMEAYIHPTVNFVGTCSIGGTVRIGAYTEIGRDVQIGDGCKIQAFAYICEGVTLEDRVFIGPHVVFTNIKQPKAGREMPREEILPTLVKTGANIGAGAIILCGVTIGENAMVGAGSVVTRNVRPNTKVVGNPAREAKG